MTSGKLLCVDCGRNSTRQRHASCHVLAILQAANGNSVTKTELLRTVYPYRWLQRVEGERPNCAPITGAIATLRQRGYRIPSYDGVVRLRGRYP